MKKFVKLLVAVALFVALSFPSHATVWTVANYIKGSHTNIYQGGGLLNSITFITGESNTTVRIYDSPYITNNLNRGAYTGALWTNYSRSYTWTNTLGSTNVTPAVTATAGSNAIITVASNVLTYPIVGSWYIKSNSSITVTWPTGLPFNRGLLVSNDVGVVSIDIIYNNFR